MILVDYLVARGINRLRKVKLKCSPERNAQMRSLSLRNLAWPGPRLEKAGLVAHLTTQIPPAPHSEKTPDFQKRRSDLNNRMTI